MYLSRIKIQSFRNLSFLDIAPQLGVNLIIGKNASGKTSVLEALYLLGHGRSFKERHLNSLIQFGQTSFSAFAQTVKGDRIANLGLMKNENSPAQIQIDGDRTRLLSKLAQALPVLLISPESFKLLYSGSAERRQFIDWGVFHVEHQFALAWQQYQRVLKQRNAELKSGFNTQALKAWDQQLASLGETVTVFRQSYWEIFRPLCLHHAHDLLKLSDLALELEVGWDRRRMSLEEALKSNLPSDLRKGYTQVGPHRADLVVKANEVAAMSVLSRGQQKLLICALYLAAGQFLALHGDKQCIYLIDDIMAELDAANQKRVLSAMAIQAQQMFVTGVEEQALVTSTDGMPVKMFHVEHLLERVADIPGTFQSEHIYV